MPAAGRRTPVSVRSSVVFPAPLVATSAVARPLGAVRLTSSRARIGARKRPRGCGISTARLSTRAAGARAGGN
ncbi:hypothetical protein FM103_11510 [Corynebacterium xerosis]|nr:hypothetical protein FM103_11510 [Corynebacterium xerosis]